ncbi:MAG: phage tail sheath subtilisin-like domain-containing protein [Defluviitaleaceae bacterium]|nr:phage tail sheath subtilisin-like domain-containing protein [Defluviitaleaceae bacterium]
MAEYLTPGVYIEEFESGPRPMSGVSTSIPGFLGLAQRGPTVGPPLLITSAADFNRRFGDYLSSSFNQYRFLRYSVEKFFANGGASCYVMRVNSEGFGGVRASRDIIITREPSEPGKGKKSEGEKNILYLTIAAKEPLVEAVTIKFAPNAGNKEMYDVFVNEEEAVSVSMVSGYPNFILTAFANHELISFAARNEDGDGTEDLSVTLESDPVKINLPYEKAAEQARLSAPIAIRITAKDTGEWGNNIQIVVRATNKVASSDEDRKLLSGVATIEVLSGDMLETYEDVSLDKRSVDSIFNIMRSSVLVDIQELDAQMANNPVKFPLPRHDSVGADRTEVLSLSGGRDENIGSSSMTDVFKGKDTSGGRTGLESFLDNGVISLIMAPGITDPAVQTAIKDHCENTKSRFAILDMPQESKEVADLQKHRETIVSDYAAMYHPWLITYDPLSKSDIAIPPSGAVAGVYARSDNTHGVHKAPANEIIRGVTGLSIMYNTAEQSHLNPRGINLIRFFSGEGIRIWGARTCSSNTLWRYINVRRLFIYIEESIKANTNWVVFEPNTEMLWLRVQRTIDVFLNEVWRSGALMGSSPSEAYYVSIGRSTMTQADIDNGRLICEIGVSPAKPAEFVIFRLTQQTLTN